MSEYLPAFIVEPVLRQARRFSERRGTEEQQSPDPSIARAYIAPDPSSRTAIEDELVTSNNRFSLPNLPQLPSVGAVDFQRFYPSRLWNQSPPPSATGERSLTDSALTAVEDDIVQSDVGSESTLQSIARNIQLWANQINNLDMFPSPPLDPLPIMSNSESDDPRVENGQAAETIDFPPLDVEVPQQPTASSQTIDRVIPPHPGRNDSETSLNPANELSYRSRTLERDSGRSLSDPLTAPNIGESSSTFENGAHGADEVRRDRDWSGSLPEDDGMGPLRKRINAIWTSSRTPQEKSRLVHALMTERYRHMQASKAQLSAPVESQYRPTSPSSISTLSHDGAFNLFPADIKPSYAPPKAQDVLDETSLEPSTPVLGCVHYRRNVKMQCDTCEKWYTCRFCHDEVENHQLPRRETKHMLCMICSTPQRVGQDCRMCGTQAACYYCSICKLWNNDPEKAIYHCDDCGICRLGEGLGKDFFHCKTCAACMSIQAESTHKCIEKSTKCDCPICGEYMFTSHKPVAFMRCGHSIHESCFADWCNTSYKCPICSKSIANMESQFRRLDRHIEEQPMPDEYSQNRAYVFCNDCNSRSVTKYHWLGLKCAVCDSYNTVQLELLGAESLQIQDRADQAQQMGVGEAGFTASQSQTPTEDLTEPASEPNSGQVTPSNTRSRPPSGITVGFNVSPINDVARSPPSRRDSPFHTVRQSPGSRPTRAYSPMVGNYFNTGQVQPMAEDRRNSYFSVFSASSGRDNTEDIAATLPPATATTATEHHGLYRRLSSRLSQSYRPRSRDNNPVDTTLTTTGAQEIHRRGTIPLDDDEDLDFWGGQSPRSYEAELVDAPVPGREDEEEESSDSEEDFGHGQDEDDDDDDDEGDDLMDILGHR